MKNAGHHLPSLKHRDHGLVYRERILRTAPRLPVHVIQLLDSVFWQWGWVVAGSQLRMRTDAWYLERDVMYDYFDAVQQTGHGA